jgi:hypothetical protein
MKRFICNETFEHEGEEYAEGAIYPITDKIEMLMPLWMSEGKVRDPDEGKPEPEDHDDDDDDDGNEDEDEPA